MSQNDFTIANQTFPNTRADINSALQALASNNSGTSAPSTQFANQFWYNSSTNILYIRNEGNDADIPIMELDQTNDTVEYFKADSVRTALIEYSDGDDALTIADGGALTTAGNLSIGGSNNELRFYEGANYVGFEAPALSADKIWVLPTADGTVNQALVTNGSGTLSWADAGGDSLRPNTNPLLINGDFSIAQRTTSKSGITTTGIDVVDRWGYVVGDAGTWTAERANDGPANNGFPQCFKWDCTTAKGTLGTNTIMYIRQILEAQDVQLFNIAQSTAKPFTVTFWVRSTKTGTYVVMLNNFTANRHVSKAYSVSSSNTWEKKTVSFPADTGGSIGNTEGAGISVNFWVAAGSAYTSGPFQQTWDGVAAGNQAGSQVNAADNTSNFFSLAGVQLEVGEYTASNVPDFQFESFGDSFARCQRYFQRYTQPPLIGSANANNSVARASIGLFPVQMRTAPTASQSGTFNWFYSNSHQPTSTALAASYTDVDGAEFDITVSGTGMTATHPCSVVQSGSGYLSFSAEI